MRWSYLIPRIVIVLAVWLAFTFGFDPLVRKGTIITAQKAAGARAEIDAFQTKFFPPRLDVRRATVADRKNPMTNLIEFDGVQARLRGGPLLMKSFIIDEATVTGVRFGTPRTESGELDEPVEVEEDTESSFPFDQYAEHFRAAGQDWLSQMIEQAKLEYDPQQLETVQVGDEVQRQWKSRFDTMEVRVRELESGARQVESNVKTAKKADQIQQIQIYTQTAADARRLLVEADSIRRELAGLTPQVRTDYQRLDQARLNDQERIRQKVEIFRPDAGAITESLLGPELTARLQQAFGWLQYARHYVSRVSEKPEPDRSYGMTVLFPRDEELPGFLIRQMRITGEATLFDEVAPFEGIVAGITSDPVLYGQPTVVELAARGQTQLLVNASFDFRDDTPTQQFVFELIDPRPARHDYGRTEKAALAIHSRDTRWTGQFVVRGTAIEGHLQMDQGSVELAAAGPQLEQPEVGRLVESVLSSVHNLNASINVAGRISRPKLTLTSNLGTQMADGFQGFLRQEVQVQKQRLLAIADEAAQEKITELRTQLGQRYNELDGRQKELVARLNLEELNPSRLAGLAGLGRLGAGDLNPQTLMQPDNLIRNISSRLDRADDEKEPKNRDTSKKADKGKGKKTRGRKTANRNQKKAEKNSGNADL